MKLIAHNNVANGEELQNSFAVVSLTPCLSGCRVTEGSQTILTV